MHLEWPLFKWFGVVIELGAAVTFFVAFSYVLVTHDVRTAATAIVPVLATYIAVAALMFSRARCLPRGPSKVRSLYAAERAVQAATFTLVGIILGAVFFAWGAWFVGDDAVSAGARAAWGPVYLLPMLLLQTGFRCFMFTLRVIAREYLHPLSARDLARRIRGAP